MANSTSPTRRTVVKGAAWATPALVVASAVPAIAASPDEEDPLCEVTADELGWYGGVLDKTIPWTPAVGTDPSTEEGRLGTMLGSVLPPRFAAPLGTWQFGVHNNPKWINQGITGYRLEFVDDVVIRSINGTVFESTGNFEPGVSDRTGANQWSGRWSTRPVETAQVVNFGWPMFGNLQTNLPYRVGVGDCGKNFPKAFLISAPFKVKFIRGLEEGDLSQPEITCGVTYYWNAAFKGVLGACGGYRNVGTNFVSAGLPEF